MNEWGEKQRKHDEGHFAVDVREQSVVTTQKTHSFNINLTRFSCGLTNARPPKALFAHPRPASFLPLCLYSMLSIVNSRTRMYNHHMPKATTINIQFITNCSNYSCTYRPHCQRYLSSASAANYLTIQPSVTHPGPL